MISMGLLHHRLLTLSSLMYGASAITWNSSISLSVDTTVGTVFGLINGTTPDVVQFLGIPYAEAPVGDLRWAPAIAKSPVGDIDATSFGPNCPQILATAEAAPSVYSIDARDFLIYGPQSEDCLSLSVWKPATAPSNAKLPVIVFFYGGGTNTGGQSINYQIPSQWVQRSQSHIAVVFNYRVNVFGFPNAAGLNQTKQNLGMLDQRLALEWVRSNIANFGGDASRISSWGQSAGASTSNEYAFAYPDDPIIAGAIYDSGAAISTTAFSTVISHAGFTTLAGNLGCGNLSASAELTCMRTVDFDTIENALLTITPALSFGPVVDNETLFSNYTTLTAEGSFAKIPAIFGSNSAEGSSLSSWYLNGTTDNVTAANIITVAKICAAQKSASLRYLNNATTFRYYYNGNFSNIAPRPWEGAYHSSELPLIFGTHAHNGPSTPFEYGVSHAMQDLWLAFISDPKSGLPASGWPAFQPEGGSVMGFAIDGLVTDLVPNDEFAARCDVLNNPLPGAVPV